MSLQIIKWEDYIAKGGISVEKPLAKPLAVTIGVFDGVHRGHQSLIRHICGSPYTPTVVTFRQNPQQILKPGADSPKSAYTGDIISLEQKLAALEFFGVQLAVLIDFSEEFSKMTGRAFIDLLLGCQPVKLVALGRNFRCGHRLDTGAAEIQSLAGARGLETWVAPPVMDEGQPVSSSRIRQALAAGRKTEAERLIGWSLSGSPPN